MKNVGTGRWRIDHEKVLVSRRRARRVRHLVQELAHRLGGLGEAAALVDIRNFDVEFAGDERRRDARLTVVLGDDLDRLDRELVFAVDGEHGHDHVDHDVQLGSIGGRDIDEHVGGVQGDLGVLRVDNTSA